MARRSSVQPVEGHGLEQLGRALGEDLTHHARPRLGRKQAHAAPVGLKVDEVARLVAPVLAGRGPSRRLASGAPRQGASDPIGELDPRHLLRRHVKPAARPCLDVPLAHERIVGALHGAHAHREVLGKGTLGGQPRACGQNTRADVRADATVEVLVFGLTRLSPVEVVGDHRAGLSSRMSAGRRARQPRRVSLLADRCHSGRLPF